MNPHALRSADAELSAGCRDGYTITPRFLQARMKTGRRPFTASETIAAFRLAAAFLAVLVPWGEAVSQTYPARPIRFLVGSPPGSGNDLVSRLLAQKLAARFGRPVVVDQKPGGAGLLANDALAKSPPDGHTLVLLSGAHPAPAALNRPLPYDPVRDLGLG